MVDKRPRCGHLDQVAKTDFIDWYTIEGKIK
jgi:hypothetical protein